MNETSRLVIEEGATFIGRSEVTSAGRGQIRRVEIAHGKSEVKPEAMAGAKAIA